MPESPSNASRADLSGLRIDRRDEPAPAGPARRVALVVLAIAAAAAIGAFAASRAGLFAPEVAVAKARLRSGGGPATILSANGYVVPRRKAAVASKATGRLVQLFVEEGSAVKEGDILGRLEHADYDAEVFRARSEFEASRAGLSRSRADSALSAIEFERQARLRAEELVDQSSYDRARAAHEVDIARVRESEALIESRRGALALAQANQEYTNIRAPFDATVLRKNAEVGEIVAPISVAGANTRGAIVELADMTSLEVEVDVNEAYIARIEIGQRVEVRLDAYPERPYGGFVRQIVPTANRQKATVVVKVAFDELDRFVLPEMGARVTFQAVEGAEGEGSAHRLIFLPAEAIAERDGRRCVLVVKEGRVRPTPVETGSTIDGEVQIHSGLRGGEMVILSPGSELADGDRVRAREAARPD